MNNLLLDTSYRKLRGNQWHRIGKEPSMFGPDMPFKACKQVQCKIRLDCMAWHATLTSR
jgi:hypothetical protein